MFQDVDNMCNNMCIKEVTSIITDNLQENVYIENE